MKTNMFAVLITLAVFNVSAQVNKLTSASPLGLFGSDESASVKYKTIRIDNLDIFYREAGNASLPTILFLHGFPSSSHMYRDILRELASRYHVVAPDYPGFGLSSSPDLNHYTYTFDNLSKTMEHFIDALQLKGVTFYVQDYGGPIGFRIAARRPELVRALIIQNANAYTEGLGEAITPMKNYFNDPNEKTESEARKILTSTKWQYTDGAGELSRINPDSYVVDQFYLDRPGNAEIQLALFRDYRSNLALYDNWHSYFRRAQPPALVIWGRNDKIFITPGAEAYKRDLKNIELHTLNGGHFLLEEYHLEVAGLIDRFLSKQSKEN